jgi:uncharacterized membrane protein
VENAVSAQIEPLPVARIRAPAIVNAHSRVRVGPIDELRGLVIVLMALDHVRDYFSAATFGALDLTQTNVALFLTRWITHFCAPTFVLLAGVSAHLISRRCTRGELTRFLAMRGVWLVILEVTVVNAAWAFNLNYQHGVFLQVIWAIGVSMIVLAALVHLPRPVIAVFAVAMIACHNLFDGVAPERFGELAWVWSLLHVQSPIPVGFVAYPLIPWIGVMALGYVLGALYEFDPQRRCAWFVRLGAAALALFVLLRLTNSYGDPQPWSAQSSAVHTLLSFLNVEKYPPSLLYLLLTLGAGLLVLAAFENARGSFAAMLRTFGRVPLFFYVAHIALAHLAAGLVALTAGLGVSVLTNAFVFAPEGWGFGLPVVYLAWFLVLATLYPACRWYAEVKQRRTDWWLSYL